ncbi:hypothetical protein NEUTE1DRAFT_116468 [Neurospora tetrasperma FGSC 2508]|uniref:Uncharacterized protein n=1 Tax=Neurospora tetrasperma (strain FGSC 2508 / ATCC MYA-4615 / P0657) TaxID=510951 RepID=F8MFR4_NEUT8|nr:uncharacterized protein NEUTE1DRAFT_116468 [Neurospora tetrasperma FGSC 2508]EGO59290.1 hypothetical protein NEUTE1DRAFT_116468 [Neurospora tetrasperma FGSC 2508]EGZ73411.1 hypothetical protein NEUTE2DRAFT_144163 [Neurospora tetrasperma FGSC 2509]
MGICISVRSIAYLRARSLSHAIFFWILSWGYLEERIPTGVVGVALEERWEKSHWPAPDLFQHRQDTKKGRRDGGESRTKCPSPAFAPHIFPHFHLYSTC